MRPVTLEVGPADWEVLSRLACRLPTNRVFLRGDVLVLRGNLHLIRGQETLGEEEDRTQLAINFNPAAP